MMVCITEAGEVEKWEGGINKERAEEALREGIEYLKGLKKVTFLKDINIYNKMNTCDCQICKCGTSCSCDCCNC